MRAGLLLATVLVLICVAGNTARACDCVTLSERESLDNADLVFEGKLIGIQRVETKELVTFSYVFQVDRTLKGPYEMTVVVTGDYTDCDANFQPRFVYRVYAKNSDGKFVSGSCSGNKILSAVGGYTSYHSTFRTVNAPMLWYRPLVNLCAVCGLGVLLGSGVFFWRKYVTKTL